MAKCPIPENEMERLSSLHAYKILDTAPEVEFDVTTRVASHLFNTPIALVALMDKDRLWFKSRQGVELEQLDREIAFCAHAIINPDELLVIEDLLKDPRFAENPLVSGAPSIRFYAGAPLRDPNGLALGTIAVLATEPREFSAEQRTLLRDLSVSVMTAIEARHRALELKQLATTDALTGLANRIQFQSALSLELSQARLAAQSIAVMYMDLDGFKGVNDSLGHEAGDAVLREFAHRILPQIRSGDTLARLGGDEFAIVMGSGSNVSTATVLAERIVEAMRPLIQILGGEQEVPMAVSIGIAVEDARATDATSLLKKADQALYKAKSQTRLRWNVFTGSSSTMTETLSSVVGDLDGGKLEPENCTACAEGLTQPFPFSMAFQPIVSISERRVFAYEALVRGTDGEPAQSVLKRVTRRSRYAFDQSCRRTAIELASRLGLVTSGAYLSINFIPGAMYEPEHCVRATLAAAQRAKLPLDRLILEVTEGDEIPEPEHLAKIFQVYQKFGMKRAIDDFGAGYAGLNLLAHFQPDIIKIDRQLIQDIDRSLPKRAIVRGVLSVCRELGIQPIAEGVETLSEYRTLHDFGIDLFQGYLFARPAFEAFPEPAFPN